MKIHSLVACQLAFAALLGAPPACAVGTLGFEQAQNLAQERSRALAAQDAATTAARDMALAASRLPDPTLKAGIDNLPVNGPDRFSIGRDFMTMRSVAVAQEFTREDKRHARALRFEREADAAQAMRALALRQLRRDSALAWLERHFQQRMQLLLASQRDAAMLQTEAAEAAYRGGRSSLADVLAARTALAQIDDRLTQSERQIATATTQLARWVGDAAALPLGDAPVMRVAALDAAALEARLAQHPQMAVLVGQEQIAQAEAEIARTNRRADWSAELRYSQRGAAYSNIVSFSVSVPLQWDSGNRQERELSARLATVEQQRAQRDEALRAFSADARTTLQQWQANRERLARHDSVLLMLAAERSGAALAAYRGGAGTLAAVLEARRGEIELHIERLRLALETARLWAQLRYLALADDDSATATEK